jgi:hypothetical protein
VTEFVHEAAIDVADGADPRAPGGAITVALCGHWEHEPPCRWPHHTDITPDGDRHVLDWISVATATSRLGSSKTMSMNPRAGR